MPRPGCALCHSTPGGGNAGEASPQVYDAAIMTWNSRASAGHLAVVRELTVGHIAPATTTETLFIGG